MTDVVLFHHVQGLTAGVEAFADELRRAGHTVRTPDLFEGRTFDSIDDGMTHLRSLGFGTVLERGAAAAGEPSPSGVVYAGFSMGVMPAQQLAQTRDDARGALFLHSCAPVEEFGESWPDGVPAQVHAMDHDPFFVEEGDGGDLAAAQALAASVDRAELFLYPGADHLFTDSSLPAYDADATGQVLERALRLLAAVRPDGRVSR